MEMNNMDFEKKNEAEKIFRKEKSPLLLKYSGENIKNLIWTIKHDLFFVCLYIQKDNLTITHILGKIEDPLERLMDILKTTLQRNKYS